MKKHLVLIGGGHSHMEVMLKLETFLRHGHRVTLVSPDSHHYYSGMGPGLLGGSYRTEQTYFDVRKMVTRRGGQFLKDRVVAIDAVERRLELQSGRKLEYDIASLNVGSDIVLGQGFDKDERTIPVKPIINLARAREVLLKRNGEKSLRLAVVGGGAAGVEVAGNLATLLKQGQRRAEVHLFVGSRLLKDFPVKARKYVTDNFQFRGIIIQEGRRINAASQGCLSLDDGTIEPFDLVFLATGIQPPKFLKESCLATGADGGLLVNGCLQSVSSPTLFGGGDCINFKPCPLAKIGVYAVRQNPILRHNLMAALENRSIRKFVPQKHYLLILNLGDGHGVLTRNRLVLNGQWPYWLKDWIDRRFMNRYQVSGEQANQGA